MGKNRSGRSSEDLIIEVPIGTQIFSEDGNILLYDMVQENEEVIIAKGGDGGFGNTHFKSSINQAPRKFIPGFPGDELWVWLKLKLLCDVGLVGLPNVGKSTFLSVCTSAKPKIADYPFTTLKPQLGVVYIEDQEFVMADLPGLIEGASEGHGLGDKFLKHVERCRVILHLIDSSTEDVLIPYNLIRNELEQYSAELIQRVELISLNKCDLISTEEIENKKKVLEDATGKKVFICSGATKHGIKNILHHLLKLLNNELEEF